MIDTIERQAAIDEIRKCRFMVDAIEKIRGLPSAQEKVGKWIITSEFDDGCQYVRCDQCKVSQVFYRHSKKPNYCPNCGVKMKEMKHEEQDRARD